MKHSAGLAIIYDKKLLLVHPTRAPWKGMYGIPKGGLDKNESVQDAAIRETFEEIGFKADKNKVYNALQQDIFYQNKKGKKYKRLTFFEYHISENELKEMGIAGDKLVIPKSRLQLDEVDWAGFMSEKSLKSNMLPNQYRLVELLNFK